MLMVDASTYKLILGVILCIPILTLLGLFKMKERAISVNPSAFKLMLVGSSIGFVSGWIGIGGGIILSPFLLFVGWAKMKETAAVSALFIFVNSIAGILGQKMVGVHLDLNIGILVGIVLIGGFAGSFFGAKKWSRVILEKVLAFVLVIAVFKLIFTE
jgi:uncharacterized membrane protein YfcA